MKNNFPAIKKKKPSMEKPKSLMGEDFSGENLRNISFKNADLSNAIFFESDLRGADFSGANLTGANFTGSKTGLIPLHALLISIVLLGVSLLSGYFAMRGGQVIQSMINSSQQNIRLSGYLAAIIFLFFTVVSIWRGIGYASERLIAPIMCVAASLALISYVSGFAHAYGMSYLMLSLVLIVLMFGVGTIARVVAGSLSTVMFWIVAVFGSVYGRSVGGGIGTVIMAIACVQISKRALSGTKGFETLTKIASFITAKFGTSFRAARLDGADFSRTTLRNADFTNAHTVLARWDNCRRVNCKSQ